ncbi:MAG: hypothetical protein H6607_12960 [Flavobacteriales bacterium]|nr:hypothetical protein [Flavobacteriales bacterium]
MKKAFLRIFILVLFVSVFMCGAEVYAQCPMCRSAVESAMQNEGNKVGVGLNKGILYLLATPYIIVAFIGTLWYKKNKRTRNA